MKAALQGWQLSGIATFWSGPPVSRLVNGNTNGGRRGIRVDAVGDAFSSLPASGPGYVYWFDPAAYAPPADGRLGNSGRAPFRLPGVNQWDLTLAKSWSFPHGVRLQLRADFLNAFNHTQLSPDGVQNVCNALAEGDLRARGRRPVRTDHLDPQPSRDPAGPAPRLELSRRPDRTPVRGSAASRSSGAGGS